MVFWVTLGAGLVALAVHALGVPLFGDPVAVPVTALVAMCAMGVIGRLLPRQRRALVAIVPRGIPAPGLVVFATGVCEAAGAIGLLVPPTRLAAAICLALLLLAVFPANVRAAHLAGDADGSFRRRILVRGLEQLAFLALCGWVVVASAR